MLIPCLGMKSIDILCDDLKRLDGLFDMRQDLMGRIGRTTGNNLAPPVIELPD
jgi:hypothetical protein